MIRNKRIRKEKKTELLAIMRSVIDAIDLKKRTVEKLEGAREKVHELVGAILQIRGHREIFWKLQFLQIDINFLLRWARRCA